MLRAGLPAELGWWSQPQARPLEPQTRPKAPSLSSILREKRRLETRRLQPAFPAKIHQQRARGQHHQTQGIGIAERPA